MPEVDSFTNYRQKYPGGDKSNYTFGGRLDRIVRFTPNHVAFVQGDSRFTWKQFSQQVNRLANAFLDLGIKKEDRVGVMGFNYIEWPQSYFACWRIGAVPFNVNPRYTVEEARHIFKDADAVAAVLDSGSVDTVDKIRNELPSLKHCIVWRATEPLHSGMLNFEELINKYPETRPKLKWKVTNEDFCDIQYTGGTTGFPKGTVWDYYDRIKNSDFASFSQTVPLVEVLGQLPKELLEGNASMIAIPERILTSGIMRRLNNTSLQKKLMLRLYKFLMGSWFNYFFMGQRCKWLVAAPLFHGTAYDTSISVWVTQGGTSYYLPTPHPFIAKELCKVVEKEKPNAMFISGDAFGLPILEELNKAKEEGKPYDLSSVALVLSSGMKMSGHIKRGLHSFMPKALIWDIMGTTEVSSGFNIMSTGKEKEMPVAGAKLAGKTKGLAKYQIPCRVVNPETGRDVSPGSDEIGEFVYGGYMSSGYWKDPERTAKFYRVIGGEKWFFAGDEGTVDGRGQFHLVGRGPTVINTGGEKVYPEEVEETIKANPKIRDVAVIGIPDERWGEAVTAMVELASGEAINEDKLDEWCRGKMAGYKRPKHYLFIDKVPRNVAGKIDRKVVIQLREKAMEKLRP